jgi:hypothetical protein
MQVQMLVKQGMQIWSSDVGAAPWYTWGLWQNSVYWVLGMLGARAFVSICLPFYKRHIVSYSAFASCWHFSSIENVECVGCGQMSLAAHLCMPGCDMLGSFVWMIITWCLDSEREVAPHQRRSRTFPEAVWNEMLDVLPRAVGRPTMVQLQQCSCILNASSYLHLASLC